MPGSFAQVLRAQDTKAISQAVLDSELIAYIKEYGQDEGEAFFLQEYDCDFNAPLLGAILGKYVTRAEREGRINNDVSIDLDGRLSISHPTLASVIQPHGGSGSQSQAGSGSWTTIMIPA
jgi:hypothetical protein